MPFSLWIRVWNHLVYITRSELLGHGYFSLSFIAVTTKEWPTEERKIIIGQELLEEIINSCEELFYSK